MVKLHNEKVNHGDFIWSTDRGWLKVLRVEHDADYMVVHYEVDDPHYMFDITTEELNSLLDSGLPKFLWNELKSTDSWKEEKKKKTPVIEVKYYRYSRNFGLGEGSIIEADMDCYDAWDYSVTITNGVVTSVNMKNKGPL